MRSVRNFFSLKILMVFAIAILGITGHLRGVEGAISGVNWTGEGETLTESEAEEVRAIWRVIGDQEIGTWDGNEWLEISKEQKEETIIKARGAWMTSGYKNIESADYFIEDINRYYDHHMQKDPQEAKDSKVGLVLSLSAFFSGIEK